MAASAGCVPGVLLCTPRSFVSATRNPVPVVCHCHSLVSQTMVGGGDGDTVSEACLSTNCSSSVDTH